MRHVALYVSLFVSAWAHAVNFPVTNLNDSGAGSLRDAIAQANTLAGADTISFSITGTIVLTSGPLQIEGPLTITGPGAGSLVIDANAANRAIAIVESSNPGCPALSGPSDYLVTLSGMTLRNARRMSDNSGGGILSAKSLVLNGMVIDDNQAKNGGGVAFFAQYPGQSLTIVNTAITNNIAKPLSVVTGASTSGGGLIISEFCPNTRTMPVTVSISDSLFMGNRVQPIDLHGRGGAIASFSDADITITNTRIVDNGVDAPSPVVAGKEYSGGGIHARSKSLRIERSEITDNDAVSDSVSAFGGAMNLFNDVLALQVPGGEMAVAIVNSTISGNLSTAIGGAINAYAHVAITLQNSTIAGNMSAPNRSSIRLVTGPTVPPSAGNSLPASLALVSSIVANNASAGSVDIGFSAIPNPVINATNSLVETYCRTCGITFNGTGNLIGADPGLAILAFNGGATRTHALLPTSLAIDIGANPQSLPTDQRGTGFPRVLGTSADMGAFEYPKSCAGFTDVDPVTTLFCANMEWLRNRAITLGCGSGVYCPAANVLREQMAAFMNRLGKTLTPEILYQQQGIGATTLPGPPPAGASRRCITAASTAAGYPRQAVVTASLSGLANGNDAAFRAAVVVSYDGGNVFDNLSPGVSTGLRSTSLANRWSEGLMVEKVDLPPGVAPIFAINIRRDDQTATTGDLADGRCQIEVAIHNRNAASSPF